MKTIGIKQFQEIVSDCLNNPDKYAGKSVVLWNSHNGPDSIEYRIIESCCVCHNKANSDNQVWFKDLPEMSQTAYAITSEAFCERKDMYGYKNRGILLDSGIISFLKPSNEEVLQWLNFVNCHEYQGKILSSNWTMIACAQSGYGLTEDMFCGNCILYEVKPSVDEWAEWMKSKCDENVLKPIVAFIKETESPIDLFYWGIAIRALKHEIVVGKYETLSQFSYDEFDSCLRSSLALKVKGFPYDELWKSIQKNSL